MTGTGDQTPHAQPQVDPKLLEFLVCPLTKKTLEYDRAAQELISRAANLAFPIRNGVPLLIAEAARSLDIAPNKYAINTLYSADHFSLLINRVESQLRSTCDAPAFDQSNLDFIKLPVATVAF